MPLSKRLFDLLLASVLLPFLAPIILIVSLALVVSQGRPIFYVSERMKTDRDGFALWKFRTMTQDPTDSGASGGHKSARITPIGRFLRRTRIDELPQLWNIFRGDMSFVGPRPPLRRYVELRPDL
jgi:lipopolysaccharide/colanic/teichoic acid biosynthesis glycosyltransferase